MNPFPSLRKKIEAFEEEKRDENSPFTLSPIKLLSLQRDPEKCPTEEASQGSWAWDICPH